MAWELKEAEEATQSEAKVEDTYCAAEFQLSSIGEHSDVNLIYPNTSLPFFLATVLHFLLRTRCALQLPEFWSCIVWFTVSLVHMVDYLQCRH